MLVGRVVDEQGAVLPGVTVVVTNQDLGTSRTVISNADGSYFMPALVPGTYSVAAELSGFSRYTREEIPLSVGRTMSMEIVLAIGSIEETITVTAESPLIDVTSKELGFDMKGEELVDAPSFNRNFTGYLDFLPGVVAIGSSGSFAADSIVVNGQDSSNVAYTFDGASNDDDHLGGSAGAQARIPIEALQEFQLLTGQFDAEFGNSSGGVLNVISKSGTNTMHGSAFGFFKAKALTAEDHFVRTQDLDKPSTSEQQIGFTVGGPVVQDKLHYFFSLERVTIDKGVTINIPSRPDLSLAQVEEVRPWNLFARGDLQLNENHTLGARWLWETSPSSHFNQNWAPGTVEFETDHDWVAGGSLISLLGDNKVNSLRIGAVYEDLHWESDKDVLDSGGSQINAEGPGLDFLDFIGGVRNQSFQRINLTYQVEDQVSWFVPDKKGDHNFKFGAQYRYMDLDYRDSDTLNGNFELATNLDFDPANPSTYPERLEIQVGDKLYNLNGHVIGTFFQDNWSINNKVTLSLGLRWDVEVMKTPNADNPFYGGSGDYPVDKDNFAPRLGFSWSLDDEGHSMIRGGFGRFYQKFRLTHLDNLFSDRPFTTFFDVEFPNDGVDPGPGNGQFPTEPMLVNGPTVNRALLDSIFPPGTEQQNQGNVRFDNADRQNAYAQTFSIGYERQLAADLSVSFDYIRLQQRDQLVLFNWNQPERSGTGRRDSRSRPDARFIDDVYQIVNAGSMDHDALQVQFDKRLRNNYRFRISYTLGNTRGNVRQGDGEFVWPQVGQELNLDQNQGPTDFHRKHNFVVSGTWIKGGLRLSTNLRLRNGLPYSLIDSTFDLNRNGEDEDEWLPAGTYSGEGPDSFTVDYDGGRNGAVGPTTFLWSIRGGYDFELGGDRVFQVYADVINLTNRPNFREPDRRRGGDLRRDTFMTYRRLILDGLPRTVQIGLRFGF